MDDLMSGVSTQSIHHFTVTHLSTFDDPATADGKAWRSVVRLLEHIPGWSDVWWSRRVEGPSKVVAIIGWRNPKVLCAFFASESYDQFVKNLRPLLSEPPSFPHAIQLSTSLQTPEYPGGITAMHLATFNRTLNRLQRHKYEENIHHFGQSLDLCANDDLPIELGDPYQSQAHGWTYAIPDVNPSVEHTSPSPSPSNNSTHSQSTFVAFVSWVSMEGEKVGESIKMKGTTNSLYDIYIRPMVDDADGGYEKDYVRFDFATQAHFDHWWKLEAGDIERRP